MYQTRLLRAVLTLAAVLLSFAALDDITTGTETDFRLEYGALVASSGWLLILTVGLLRDARPLVGGISLAALVGDLGAAGDRATIRRSGLGTVCDDGSPPVVYGRGDRAACRRATHL